MNETLYNEAIDKPNKPMIRALVLGAGGREHAIAFKLITSPSVEHVSISPGNAGTSFQFEPGNGGVQLNYNQVSLDLTPPYTKLISFIKKEKINLVVPGSESYLADGITDHLLEKGISVFGPSKYASGLETSKKFAKEIMLEGNIPTAEYNVFTDYESARAYLEENDKRVVLKADGLCAGKGVIVTSTKEEAIAALGVYFKENKFGEAGNTLIVEEYLEGEEVSILAFCDGKEVRLLPPSQDHKRIYDGDQGPNTGGMGCYTPVKFLDGAKLKHIEENIFLPILEVLQQRGSPFRGVLYAGLIIKNDEIKVLEFNVRLGDPECQCVLPLLETDFGELCLACVNGDLGSVDFKVKDLAGCTVVVSSQGYPDSYETGKAIKGLNNVGNGLIFHSGTEMKDQQLITNGGRVLSITCYDENLPGAIKKVYHEINKVSFPNMHFRKDIGAKGV